MPKEADEWRATLCASTGPMQRSKSAEIKQRSRDVVVWIANGYARVRLSRAGRWIRGRSRKSLCLILLGSPPFFAGPLAGNFQRCFGMVIAVIGRALRSTLQMAVPICNVLMHRRPRDDETT